MAIYHTSEPITNSTYADVEYIKKSMLGFDFTDVDDESLLIVAESASRLIDDYTNNIFYQQQIINEKHTSIEDKDLRLVVRTTYKPIVKIESIRLETVPDEVVVLDTKHIDIHPEKGLIYVYSSGRTYTGSYLDLRRFSNNRDCNIVIDYTAGPLLTPTPIKRATALLVRNMLRPGQLSSGIKLQDDLQGGALKKVQSKSYSEEYDVMNTGAPSMKISTIQQDDFLFTADVKAMLRPYVKFTIL